jgi:hypothetical protein
MSQGTTAQFRRALSGNPIPLPHVWELLVGSGCELAQAFCRLGSQVIIAQDAPLFLPKVERDAVQLRSDAFARIVVRNALFLGRKRWSALTIPWCTYTDPEVAHVGIGLAGMARVIHTYPTQAEAIKKAADAYNRTRLTPAIKWLSRRWLAW